MPVQTSPSLTSPSLTSPSLASPSLSAASRAQGAPGSTRRSVILIAAAAASSALVQYEVARAAVVQTDAAKLPPLPLPPGIRSRYVPNINGLTFHVLETGSESKEQ